MNSSERHAAPATTPGPVRGGSRQSPGANGPSDNDPDTTPHEEENLDEALELVERSTRDRKPLSVGLLGNAADVLPELLERGVTPDAVTDQTSAHDPAKSSPRSAPASASAPTK